MPAGHSATGAGTMGVVAQPAAAPGGQVASTPDVPAGSAAPPIEPAVPMPPLVSTLPSNGSLYSRSAEPRAQQVLVQQTLRPTAGVGAAAAVDESSVHHVAHDREPVAASALQGQSAATAESDDMASMATTTGVGAGAAARAADAPSVNHVADDQESATASAPPQATATAGPDDTAPMAVDTVNVGSYEFDSDDDDGEWSVVRCRRFTSLRSERVLLPWKMVRTIPFRTEGTGNVYAQPAGEQAVCLQRS